MVDRVTLRDVIENDIAVFFAQQLDAESLHMAAFTSKDPTDEEAFRKKWAKIIGNDRFTKKTILSHGQVAGHVVIFEQEGDNEVTYWLGKEFWGQGLATAALAEMLRVTPERPIYGRVVDDNQASLRILEQNGFLPCGEEESYANGRQENVRELIFKLE